MHWCEMTLLVLRAEEEEVRLGGAANVACLLRHLGARVTLAGVVGDDPGGRTVRRMMDEIQIRGDGLLIDPARCTTTKERLMGRAARARGIPLLVDPDRVDDYDHYRGAAVLTPNRAEAERATGMRIAAASDAFAAKVCRSGKLALFF